ncbi:MAG: hypothetical protein B6I36_09625 [Desulfobacteraceae bacterium 4572_35.1]|nr:MAG: hypothetical protein B6I36_09625 [Desulfobacteraceae bacterium 4572_35.1]
MIRNPSLYDQKKPSFRGFFLIVLFSLGGLIHLLKLPGFYGYAHLSQEMILLAFLDTLLLYFIFCAKPARLELTWYHCAVVFLAVFVVGTNSSQPVHIAILLTYIVLLFMLQPFAQGRFLPFTLSMGALLSMVVSLYVFQANKLGEVGLADVVERWVGEKFTGSLSGVYGQPNLLACFFVVGIFAYMHLREGYGRRGFISLAPVGALAFALFLTTSRAGLLALLLAYLLWALLAQRQQRLIGSGRQLGYFALMLLVALVGAQFYGLTSLEKTLDRASLTSGDVSSYVRVNLWYSSLKIGIDEPLQGVGLGNFKKVLGDYTRESADTLRIGYDTISQTLWAHNDFLQILAENGFVVFAGFVLLLIFTLRTGLKSSEGKSFFLVLGLLGFAIVMLFSHPFRYHALNFVFVVLLALIWKNERVIWAVSPNWQVKTAFILACLLLNAVLIHQINNNRYLADFKQKITRNPDLETFKKNKIFLEKGLGDEIFTWQFRHMMYMDLSDTVLRNYDKKFAAYLLPEMLVYAKQNAFHSMAYALSRIYFVLGNYSQAKKYAEKAYRKKPDIETYSNFIHICQVLLISRNNSIPTADLFGQEHYQELFDLGILSHQQFNKQGVAI